MRELHSLLKRQIKKHLEEIPSLSAELKPFIHSVNEAYRQSDIDRGMLERALDLSSEELLQANAEMRAVFQAFPDVFILLDERGHILDYKGPSRQESVFPLKKPAAGTIFDLLVVPDQETIREALSRVAGDGAIVVLEYDVQTVEAGSLFYEVRLVPLREGQIMVLIRDITEQKRAQEALRKANREWHDIFNAIGHPTVIMDRSHNILAANDATLRLTGLSEWEIAGKKCYEVFHRRGPSEVPSGCPLEKLITSGRLETVEMELEALDGFYLVTCTPVSVDKGEMSKLIHIATDVTERRRAVNALGESEERYRTFVDSTDDMVFLKDLEGRYLMVNRANAEFFSRAKGDILGKTDFDLMPEEEAAQCRQTDLRSMEEKEGISISTEELGDRIYETRKFRVPLGQDRSGVGGFIRDITEHRRAEREKEKLQSQFLEAQKMEAVGTLAGGIAHDFNNLLMGIQGYNSLMMLNLDPGHPYYGKLKNVEQLVQSGADLTKQLLGYARRGKYEVRLTDVGYLMTRTSEMFGRTKKEISIYRKYQDDLWDVAVDRGQMEQVFLNLFVNAWQAMPAGGNLFLEADNVFLDEDGSSVHGFRPGRYVRMTVTDTGVGMDEKTRHRVFEPFFTTRAMGRGTGLGLASAYGIIKNHGGYIDVESKRGVGTTFLIHLPAAEERMPAGETPAPPRVMRGSETLLLVDDEKVNLETTAELMGQLGYRVFVAGSGQEALAVYAEKGDAIDIVVLDMILPGMSGEETYSRLKKVNPDVRVLLCSGYSLDDRAKKILTLGCDGFIQKPFRMENLSRKIQDIIYGGHGKA
jgi:PAS domain S-box-containing protein